MEAEVINILKKISSNPKILDVYLKKKNNSVNYVESIKNIKKQINKNTEAINALTDKLVLLEGASIDIVSKKIKFNS